MRNFILIILIISGGLLFSQEKKTDSVYLLKEVNINASRINEFSVGLNVEKVDSLFLTNFTSSSISNVLSSYSSVFVKTYGQGSLATSSFRGTSSLHTGLFWNGFRINPSNIGVSDLSLIPSMLFESIKLQYGGASSLYGNGVIGGSIHLDNPALFKDNFAYTLNSSYASFDNFSLGGNLQFSNENYSSKTSFFIHNSENDFPYKYGNETRYQQNAAINGHSFMQDFSRKISKDQNIKVSIWYQYTNREIPGTLTSKPGNAFQIDRSLRASVKWKKTTSIQRVNAGIAFIDDFQHYTDIDDIPETNIDSKYKTKSIIAETEWKRYLDNNISLNSGVNYTVNIANISSYQELKIQNQAAVFLSFSKKFTQLKWKSNLNIRQEFIEGYKVPVSPAVGFEGKIWKFISGKLNISRNFRAPTLNDRYWQPGGNEHLMPEKSWNEEAGIIFTFSGRKKIIFDSKISATAYNMMVDNWILWKPLAGTAIWTPQNIQKVWSRGFEIKAKTKINFYGLRMTFLETYTFSKSTFREETNIFDSFEKQLIYTPLHNFSSSSTFTYRSFLLRYSQTYTGKRFVSSDNEESLPGFIVAELCLGKTIKMNKSKISMNFKINNIWNTEYQIIQYRPMPGRSFLLNFNFKYN